MKQFWKIGFYVRRITYWLYFHPIFNPILTLLALFLPILSLFWPYFNPIAGPILTLFWPYFYPFWSYFDPIKSVIFPYESLFFK